MTTGRASVVRRWASGRGVAALLGTVLLLAGALATWAATGSSAAASYRTAVVSRADVQQSLNATGTVSRVGERSLAFGAAGTVGTVRVAVGDRVQAGRVVATLERSALKAAVTKARAALSRARAVLAADRVTQSAAAVAASTPATTTTPTPTSTPTSAAGDRGEPTTPATSTETVAAAQAALLDAVRAADQAVQVAAAALAAQATTCGAVSASAPATQGDAPAVADPVAACRTALDTVQAAQVTVSHAQGAAQRAIDHLASVLDATTKATPAATPTPTPTATPATPSAPSAPNAPNAPNAPSSTSSESSGTRPAATSATVTAATLARDQSTVDSSRAALIRAAASLAASTITTPVSGTVAAVTVAPGDQVSATGSGQVVVLSDDGQAAVTVDVDQSDIRSVKLGQDARVTPDGGTRAVPGRVTAIGLLSSSTSGTAAYPVTVSVAGAPLSMASGSDASVSVVVATVTDALTVPSSAVAGTGGSATVRVLAGGVMTATPVTVGAVGAVRTQVVKGLRSGQVVVLADLSQPLPTSDTADVGRGAFGGRGGFGGGPAVSGVQGPAGRG
jgi:multidrug efflux pump subunit AcrA (membrane-fusion protein)